MDFGPLSGRRLEHLLEAVKVAGFDGTNVTFPCKEAVIALLDAMSAEAQQIGAVNGVTISANGRTIGYNTSPTLSACIARLPSLWRPAMLNPHPAPSAKRSGP
jgi:hypothetical protein